MEKIGAQDIVLAVACRCGLSGGQADAAFRAVLWSVAQALQDGQSVRLPGLGTLTVRERAPRVGRDPLSGEVRQERARRAVIFKPALELQRTLEGRALTDQ